MQMVTQRAGFLRGSKMMLECYDDGKLVNHGSIKLRLQHYLEKSFQDHSFYIVDQDTEAFHHWSPSQHQVRPHTSVMQIYLQVCFSYQEKARKTAPRTPFKTIDWEKMVSMETSEEQIWVTVHSFQDHLGNLHGDKKSGKRVLSRPSTKCAKNGPKSGSSKVTEPHNVHKKGSFKTIQDGSKKDTSFKTIVNRVKNLNPWYMVPVDEADSSHFRQKRRHNQPQNSRPAVPPPPGSWFNPIYMEPGSVTIDSTRDLQALFPNSFDCIGDMQGWVRHQDRPDSPTSPAWKTESSHWVQRGDWEGVSRDGPAENHHQTDWAHTMGQQPDVP